MNIEEIIPTLKAQRVLRKTPCGRPITEKAVATIDAALSDEKNHDAPATRCLNCCIILSSLLVPEGCVNCGGKDLTTNITKDDIL
jgi:hypothetical protein